ncbi:MAG TPA: hypothetical protein PLD20_26930 [Blastocatellia bacterium]|nr:hypothetical protein [Blastocatellia bacterium]HMV84850.1 hypothetical protein [Blastocatellia bacterium]HMX26290.1 hypothetical protein [Blastocatellia bacterium]HMY73154.1 hypothetical protein [Blastocatellia bacterium]HMZ21598.1 hypothetical protein [Blastocatellia bacterium]
MHTISDAKKHLRDQYRHEEGFVGIGIGQHGNQEVLHVYVTDSESPIAQQLKQSGEFEGYPVEIEESGFMQALPASGLFR